jgi:hypothetical protein
LQAAIDDKASATSLATAEGRIAVNEGNIKTLQDEISTVKTTVSSKADTSYVDNKIADINSTVSQKADKVTVTEMQSTMATKNELEQGL